MTAPDTDARSAILSGIRRALGRDVVADTSAVDARIAARARNLIPARTDGDDAHRLAVFRHYAEAVDASVDRVADMAAVPAAVSAYLVRENLAARVVMAPDATLDAAPWDDEALLEIRRGVPGRDDAVSVTSAAAGVAETGTLMMLSGPEHPSTLNFLPETHIVVLPASRIVGAYEDAWQMAREEGERRGQLPRTVNFVTGPSRSADIQLTLLLGAHGPRRLHIVIVDD